MKAEKSSYHHGDLRAALLSAALDVINEQGPQGHGQGLDMVAHQRVEVEHVVVDVADVQERGALEPDVDERGLHPGKDAHDLAQVDVSDVAAAISAVDVELNESAVLQERHARFARGRVRDDLGGQCGLPCSA